MSRNFELRTELSARHEQFETRTANFIFHRAPAENLESQITLIRRQKMHFPPRLITNKTVKVSDFSGKTFVSP